MGNNQSNYMQQSIPQELGVIEVYRPSRSVGSFCEMIIFLTIKLLEKSKMVAKSDFNSRQEYMN